jgi:hypothetical protein
MKQAKSVQRLQRTANVRIAILLAFLAAASFGATIIAHSFGVRL